MKRRKWVGSQKAEFLYRLGVLTDQGYSMSVAIELLMYVQTKEVEVKLTSVLKGLREGSSLHESLEEMDFPKDIVGFIYFAEKYGNLSRGLKEAGDLYRKREEMKQSLQKMMRYPLLLLWLVVVMSIVMFRYLFPHFTILFSTMNIDLPLITIIMLNVIDRAPLLLVIFCTVSSGIFVYYVKVYRRYSPHKQAYILLKIPFLHKLVKLLLTYYFSVQMSGLLKGGVSIYDSLTIFASQDHIRFFQGEGKEMKQLLEKGDPFSEVFVRRPYYQSELSLIIRHGQAEGKLAEELLYYSEWLFAVIEKIVKDSMFTLQTILFLFVGMIVMLMFIAILLPMFQLIQSV